NMHAANAEAMLAMYRGDPRRAIEAWRCRYDQLMNDMILMSPTFRFLYVRSLGTALLAVADDRRNARRIAKLARTVRKLRFPFARAIHAHLRASVAPLEGRRDRSTELLLEAARHYDTADLVLDGAACRFRAGQTDAEG